MKSQLHFVLGIFLAAFLPFATSQTSASSNPIKDSCVIANTSYTSQEIYNSKECSGDCAVMNWITSTISRDQDLTLLPGCSLRKVLQESFSCLDEFFAGVPYFNQRKCRSSIDNVASCWSTKLLPCFSGSCPLLTNLYGVPQNNIENIKNLISSAFSPTSESIQSNVIQLVTKELIATQLCTVPGFSPPLDVNNLLSLLATLRNNIRIIPGCDAGVVGDVISRLENSLRQYYLVRTHQQFCSDFENLVSSLSRVQQDKCSLLPVVLSFTLPPKKSDILLNALNIVFNSVGQFRVSNCSVADIGNNQITCPIGTRTFALDRKSLRDDQVMENQCPARQVCGVARIDSNDAYTERGFCLDYSDVSNLTCNRGSVTLTSNVTMCYAEACGSDRCTALTPAACGELPFYDVSLFPSCSLVNYFERASQCVSRFISVYPDNNQQRCRSRLDNTISCIANLTTDCFEGNCDTIFDEIPVPQIQNVLQLIKLQTSRINSLTDILRLIPMASNSTLSEQLVYDSVCSTSGTVARQIFLIFDSLRLNNISNPVCEDDAFYDVASLAVNLLRRYLNNTTYSELCSSFEVFKTNLTAIWTNKCNISRTLSFLYDILPTPLHFLIPRAEIGFQALVKRFDLIQLPFCPLVVRPDDQFRCQVGLKVFDIYPWNTISNSLQLKTCNFGQICGLYVYNDVYNETTRFIEEGLCATFSNIVNYDCSNITRLMPSSSLTYCVFSYCKGDQCTALQSLECKTGRYGYPLFPNCTDQQSLAKASRCSSIFLEGFPFNDTVTCRSIIDEFISCMSTSFAECFDGSCPSLAGDVMEYFDLNQTFIRSLQSADDILTSLNIPSQNSAPFFDAVCSPPGYQLSPYIQSLLSQDSAILTSACSSDVFDNLTQVALNVFEKLSSASNTQNICSLLESSKQNLLKIWDEECNKTALIQLLIGGLPFPLNSFGPQVEMIVTLAMQNIEYLVFPGCPGGNTQVTCQVGQRSFNKNGSLLLSAATIETVCPVGQACVTARFESSQNYTKQTMCIPQSYENYGFCNYFLSYRAIPPRLSNCIVEEVCARGPCNGNAPSTCNNIPLYDVALLPSCSLINMFEKVSGCFEKFVPSFSYYNPAQCRSQIDNTIACIANVTSDCFEGNCRTIFDQLPIPQLHQILQMIKYRAQTITSLNDVLQIIPFETNANLTDEHVYGFLCSNPTSYDSQSIVDFIPPFIATNPICDDRVVYDIISMGIKLAEFYVKNWQTFCSEFERFKMNLTSIWSSRCDERSLLRELYQILPVSFHFIIPRIEPGINAAIMTLNQIQFPGCYGYRPNVQYNCNVGLVESSYYDQTFIQSNLQQQTCEPGEVCGSYRWIYTNDNNNRIFAEEGVCTSYSDITQNNFNCPNKTGIPLPQNAEGCSFFYCLGNDCTGLNQRGCPRISSNDIALLPNCSFQQILQTTLTCSGNFLENYPFNDAIMCRNTLNEIVKCWSNMFSNCLNGSCSTVLGEILAFTGLDSTLLDTIKQVQNIDDIFQSLGISSEVSSSLLEGICSDPSSQTSELLQSLLSQILSNITMNRPVCDQNALNNLISYQMNSFRKFTSAQNHQAFCNLLHDSKLNFLSTWKMSCDETALVELVSQNLPFPYRLFLPQFKLALKIVTDFVEDLTFPGCDPINSYKFCKVGFRNFTKDSKSLLHDNSIETLCRNSSYCAVARIDSDEAYIEQEFCLRTNEAYNLTCNSASVMLPNNVLNCSVEICRDGDCDDVTSRPCDAIPIYDVSLLPSCSFLSFGEKATKCMEMLVSNVSNYNSLLCRSRIDNVISCLATVTSKCFQGNCRTIFDGIQIPQVHSILQTVMDTVKQVQTLNDILTLTNVSTEYSDEMLNEVCSTTDVQPLKLIQTILDLIVQNIAVDNNVCGGDVIENITRMGLVLQQRFLEVNDRVDICRSLDFAKEYLLKILMEECNEVEIIRIIYQNLPSSSTTFLPQPETVLNTIRNIQIPGCETTKNLTSPYTCEIGRKTFQLDRRTLISGNLINRVCQVGQVCAIRRLIGSSNYSEEGLCLPLQQAVCNLTDIFCSGENCVGDSCVQFTSSSCPATENGDFPFLPTCSFQETINSSLNCVNSIWQQFPFTSNFHCRNVFERYFQCLINTVSSCFNQYCPSLLTSLYPAAQAYFKNEPTSIKNLIQALGFSPQISDQIPNALCSNSGRGNTMLLQNLVNMLPSHVMLGGGQQEACLNRTLGGVKLQLENLLESYNSAKSRPQFCSALVTFKLEISSLLSASCLRNSTSQIYSLLRLYPSLGQFPIDLDSSLNFISSSIRNLDIPGCVQGACIEKPCGMNGRCFGQTNFPYYICQCKIGYSQPNCTIEPLKAPTILGRSFNSLLVLVDPNHKFEQYEVKIDSELESITVRSRGFLSAIRNLKPNTLYKISTKPLLTKDGTVIDGVEFGSYTEARTDQLPVRFTATINEDFDFSNNNPNSEYFRNFANRFENLFSSLLNSVNSNTRIGNLRIIAIRQGSVIASYSGTTNSTSTDSSEVHNQLQSAIQNSTNFTALEIIPEPPSPPNVTIISVDSSSVTLELSSVVNATSYSISITCNSDFEYSSNETNSQRVFNVNGLDSSDVCSASARAEVLIHTTQVAFTDNSDPVEFQTGPLVSNLAVQIQSIQGATVSFDSVPRAVSYSVLTYTNNPSNVIDNITLTASDEVNGKVEAIFLSFEAGINYTASVRIQSESTNGIELRSPKETIMFQTDVDECAENPSLCGDDGVCMNTFRSFQCTCNSGFYLSGVTCLKSTASESTTSESTRSESTTSESTRSESTESESKESESTESESTNSQTTSTQPMTPQLTMSEVESTTNMEATESTTAGATLSKLSISTLILACLLWIVPMQLLQ